MPSTSKKQHNFMAAVAKNPAFAKKVGIKPSVGEHFLTADKGKKFGSGGMAKKDMESKKETREEMAMDKKQDKSMIKKAFSMHDKQEHKGGKGTNLSALKKGGMACKMAGGGKVGQLSKADGIASKGKSKGKMITMCGGGSMGKKGK